MSEKLDQPIGAKEAGVENIPGPHRSSDRMVAKNEYGAYANSPAQPDQDLRLRLERGDNMGEQDVREPGDQAAASDSEEVRDQGYVGFSPSELLSGFYDGS